MPRSAPHRLYKAALLLGLAWLSASAALAETDGGGEGPIASWTHQGVRVYHLRSEQPAIVDARLWFRAGSAYSDNNSSVAYLTNQGLGRATAELDESALDLRLGLLGARFHRGIGRDGAWLGMRSLSSRASDALELLRQIAAEPRWSKDDLALAQEKNAVGIDRAMEDGSSRLDIESFRQLYGDHSYARMVVGSKKDSARATLDDLDAFYRRYYTMRNMSAMFVGDIDRKAIDSWLDGLLKSLPKGERRPAPAWIKKTPLPKKLRVGIDSSQVHWNAISLGLTRDHTDYPLMALTLFMLDKRFEKVLRDRMGLTYHSSVHAIKLIGRGMVRMYFSTRAEGADEAVKVARQLMSVYFSQGIDAEELQRSITHLTGLLSISYNSNRAILGLMQIIAQEDLPTDYLGRLIERIATTTPEEINQFIGRYFAHRKFAEVLVGPAKTPLPDQAPEPGPRP